MIQPKLRGMAIALIVLLPICFIAICFLDYLLFISLQAGAPKGSIGESTMGVLYTIFLNLSFLYFFISVHSRAFTITINTHENIIIFKNIISIRTKTYNLNWFDGYIETQSLSRGGPYKMLFFIKNRRVEKIVSGYYYTDINELTSALSPIKNLGFKKNGTMLEWRAIFKMPLNI